MREIKFRAWDKEGNRMVYSSKTYHDADFVCYESGCIKCYVKYPYCDSFGDEYDKWQAIDNIMQYTGLKDKNGVQIYEGDILNLENHNVIRVVRFDEQVCSFEAYNVNSGEGYYLIQSPFHEYEVIGNIYENQELLKESKHE